APPCPHPRAPTVGPPGAPPPARRLPSGRRRLFRSEPAMSKRRVGLWLIGACGGVGTTAALGLSALTRRLPDTTPLGTALPLFAPLDLDEPGQFVVGGHEVRQAGFCDTMRELHHRANVFDHDLIEACTADLETWQANVRPGTVLNAGASIARLADWPEAQR